MKAVNRATNDLNLARTIEFNLRKIHTFIRGPELKYKLWHTN